MNANLADAIASRSPRPNYGRSSINHQWTDDTTGLTFSGVMYYDYEADGEQLDGRWYDSSSVEFRVFVLTHVSYGNTSRALDKPIEMNPDCCYWLDDLEFTVRDVERGGM